MGNERIKMITNKDKIVAAGLRLADALIQEKLQLHQNQQADCETIDEISEAVLALVKTARPKKWKKWKTFLAKTNPDMAAIVNKFQKKNQR